MMSPIRLVFPLGVALIATAFLSVSAEEVASFPTILPSQHVKVVAHQGARDQAPENTFAAIEYSIVDAVECVEVDVRLSRDGKHVLIHDDDLGRTTDGLGLVADRTLAELKSLDAGSKFAKRFAGQSIPTLEEALALAKGRVNLQLNCRQVAPVRLIRDLIQAGMERQVVVSARPDVIRSIRAATDGDRLALMLKWKPTDGLDAWGGLKVEAVEVNAVDLTPELCQGLHERGLKVQARTLGADDLPAVWDRMSDAGVDGILTDRTEEILAREILRRVGSKVRVKVAHHRGASRYAPENTLPAYEKAIRLGADLVEFDIRTSRDGLPFLLHDGRLDRTTNARGPIRELGAAEIARLDAGAWFGRPFLDTPIPPLDDFLKTIGSRVELYVDAKDISPEALVASLRARDLIDRSIVYQSPDYLARLRAIEPRLRRMPPLSNPSRIDSLADRLEPYAFDTRWDLLSKPLIDRCHARGIKVFSDAIGPNESVDSYRRAILDGIDLIQTDHPIRVLRAIDLLNTSNRPPHD
jgi:glycerophosphoryl diester phosphodiesterase